MPELSDSLRDLFEAEARVPASPTHGLPALASRARGARRRNQARVAALATGALVIVGVAATVGAGALRPTTVTPAVTSEPSATMTSVTWDPAAAAADATSGFSAQCGDTWLGQEVQVAGVMPIGAGSFRPSEGESSEAITVDTGFISDPDPMQLLGNPLSYIVVKDGVIVGLSTYFDELTLYTTGSVSNSSIVFSASGTCAAQHETNAVFEAAGFDPASDELSDPEWAGLLPPLDAIDAKYVDLDPGKYEIYLVSPVIFGPQLALAQALSHPDFYGHMPLTQNIGLTPLGDDPRLAPYCTKTQGIRTCNPPQHVLDEVLTLPVDESTIDNTPSGVAISAPITVTVP